MINANISMSVILVLFIIGVISILVDITRIDRNEIARSKNKQHKSEDIPKNHNSWFDD